MMINDMIIEDIKVYRDGLFKTENLYIKDGIFVDSADKLNKEHTVLDGKDLHMFPGFCDLHVHFREPGKEYKETIETGAMAAAHGGYICVCTMPNLDPVPDSIESLDIQFERIIKASLSKPIPRIVPYASISKGEKGECLSNMEDLAPYVAAFSDDGVGVANESLMEEAMSKAKMLGKAIVAHAEDIDLVAGGTIHDGEYAKKYGHKGNPSASEYAQVRRDLKLAEKTGVHYHVCHVSSKESVESIVEAQSRGLDITFETAPHYLTLTDMDLEEDGRFKMNPPIRGKEDQKALRKAMKEGKLSAIATDHAPHSSEEKARGLDNSLNGIVGLETAFPVCYTELVMKGLISLEELVYLISIKPYRTLKLNEVKDPRRIVADPEEGLKLGNDASFTIFDLSDSYIVDPKDFLSKGKASPFTGNKVFGRCIMTVVEGEEVYSYKSGIEKRSLS